MMHARVVGKQRGLFLPWFHVFLLLAVMPQRVGAWHRRAAFDKLVLLRGGGTARSNNQSTKQVPKSITSWSFDKPCVTMPWTPMVSTRVCVMENPQVDLILVDSSEQKSRQLVVVGIVQSKENDKEDNDEQQELCTTGQTWGPTTCWLNDQLHGFLKTTLEENRDFHGKVGSLCGGDSFMRFSVPQSDGTVEMKRIVMIGLGTKSDGETARKFAKAVASLLKKEKDVSSCDVLLPHSTISKAFCSELSTALLSELYADKRFKSKPKGSDLANTVRLAFDTEPVQVSSDVQSSSSACSVQDLQHALDRGRLVARGVYLAKDIVNCPHNTLNSHGLADTAKRIASASGGRLKCTVLEQRDCERRGMGAYLGVARGSETMPKFIHLTYRPKRNRNKKIRKVGIVGKGLLMDTGGYNIKTSMMELMKFDCGGAAAVLGAAMAIAALEPAGVEAHFVIAACENMINERAVVPGDILTASNGKTIEVINTDAEGRLTMADALVYVDKELGCEEIIELSTLTGACMMALGSAIAGLWTASDDLATALQEVSESTGEKLWRMPLEKEYKEQLKSKIADLRNLGGRYPGAITAALFLQDFVEPDKPFAHIDIAGPVWNMKHGATGYGVKCVTEWVCRQADRT